MTDPAVRRLRSRWNEFDAAMRELLDQFETMSPTEIKNQTKPALVMPFEKPDGDAA
jgi:hypothetical protein